MIALQLADANFDWQHHVPNFARWAEINTVLERLAELERFAHLRDNS